MNSVRSTLRVLGDQAAVRPHEGALSRVGEERCTAQRAVRAVEPEDGAQAIADDGREGAPGGGEERDFEGHYGVKSRPAGKYAHSNRTEPEQCICSN